MLLISSPAMVCDAAENSSKSSTGLNLYELPLEALLQVIISASKHEENLFKSPVAAHVLAADKIAKSGVTSIPEALRLVPGVIVREQTNGNYDVHIRGLDNIPPNSQVVRTANNNLTLVMIDNRVVNNHYTGGIFWDQLPITIHDIERIEVLKGATAALHGPNAVTGVIHILTKQTHGEDSFHFNAQGGTHDTHIINLSKDFQIAGLGMRISAHQQERNRYETHYFEFFRQQYLAEPADILTLPFSPGGPLPDPHIKYPSPEKALSREGINFYLEDNLGSVKNRLSIGYQSSFSQKVFDDNGATPFTSVESDSGYINLESKWSKLIGRVQVEAGTADTLGSPFFSFDYRNEQLMLDGNYQLGSVMLQPLFHYSKQHYEGEGFSGEANMEIYSAGLRGEYIQNKWRYTGSLRTEHYNFTDKLENSFLFGLAYQAREDLLLRGSLGHSTQEPFMFHIFVDLQFPNTNITAKGNPDLAVVESDNVELGLRWAIDQHKVLDIELFDISSKNYQALTSPDFVQFTYQNLPDEGILLGITASYEYEKGDWIGSFFMTIQKTKLKQATTTENVNTPDYYGGFSLNYAGHKNWDFNLSTYFFDEYAQLNARTFDMTSETPLSTIIDEAKVTNRFLASMKASYEFNKKLSAFINIRNLLGKDEREFAMTDNTKTLTLIGLDARF